MKAFKKDKIIIYFPATGGYNLTPPYEMLFQLEALKPLDLDIVLVDSRTTDIEKILEQHNSSILMVVISTVIKYSSITILKQYEDGLFISEFIRSKYTIPVIWTGLAATIMSKTLASNPSVDYILKGISESVLLKLAEKIVNGFLGDQIKVGKFEYKNGLILQSSEKSDNNFEKYGKFELAKLDIKQYIHNNTFDYIASTGCINCCSFCSVPFVYGQNWKNNSIQNILDHFRFIKKNYPQIQYIHFREDNFAVKKSFVFKLFKTLSENDIYFGWSAQTSINVLKTYTNEDLKKLKEHGCNNLSIGIESGDVHILEKVTKNKTSINDSITTINRLIKNKIEPSVTSIIGFPDNKGRDFNQTLKLLMRLKLIYPSLSLYCTIFQPIPETEAFSEVFGKEKNPENIMFNNNWTTEKQKKKLIRFEKLYLTFCDKYFYKRLSPEIGQKIKRINTILYPFIRLRFKMKCTSFLWEYYLAKRKLDYLHKDMDMNTVDFGIRRHNTNYNFGYKSPN